MKLSGTQDVYRIRVGKYRVIYDVKGKELVIEVIRVAQRKNSYRYEHPAQSLYLVKPN